jgi:hypothetical protein
MKKNFAKDKRRREKQSCKRSGWNSSCNSLRSMLISCLRSLACQKSNKSKNKLTQKKKAEINSRDTISMKKRLEIILHR